MSSAAAGRASILERLRDAIELLESIASDGSMLAGVPADERKRLLDAAGTVYSPDRAERRRKAKAAARQRKAARVEQTEGMRDGTGIRSLRRRPVFHTPNVFPPGSFAPNDVHTPRPPDPGSRVRSPGPTVNEPQPCYVCKQKYSAIHHFYDQLCPRCADVSFAKRAELADLRGRVAVLTGGRVKIGYQAGLKLLRSGVRLLVTTRFPRDAAMRYTREPDFAEWEHRLEIFGLDLRHTPSVEAFCRELLATRTRLDFIVNNACQTVRRPPEFYAHMMAGENAALHEMPEHVRRLLGSYEGVRGSHLRPARADAGTRAALDRRMSDVAGLTHAAQLTQVPLLPEELAARTDLFPDGSLDRDLQQVDLRGRNSWRLLLAEVSSVELLEVQLVNAVAPFVINARLNRSCCARQGATSTLSTYPPWKGSSTAAVRPRAILTRTWRKRRST